MVQITFMSVENQRALNVEFNPQFAGRVGIELEGMLILDSGGAVPIVNKKLIGKLQQVGGLNSFVSPELSAAQIEIKTSPVPASYALYDLQDKLDALRCALRKSGLPQVVFQGLGPENMPLTVYPDNPRYSTLFQAAPKDVRQFACRAMAFQLHIGVASRQSAIALYDAFVARAEDLIREFYSQRLEQYLRYVPYALPQQFSNWQEFENFCFKRKVRCAEQFGNIHSLVRITKHGTVELRFFDSSLDFELFANIIDFAIDVYNLVIRYERNT